MPTVAVLLVDALLTTVNWPDTGPATCGSKFTSIVTAEVGFKVTGKVAPEMVKPVPLKVAELIVTGAVPVDVSVTGSVDAVFNVTFPKVKLAVLMDKEATFAAAAFSCIEKVLETPPALAVNVTACDVVTGDAVAVNPTLVSFAGTVTMTGTATAALPLLKLTLKPLLPAAKEGSLYRHRSRRSSGKRHHRRSHSTLPKPEYLCPRLPVTTRRATAARDCNGDQGTCRQSEQFRPQTVEHGECTAPASGT